MFTVITDLFDALNHFKTTSPWTPCTSEALNIFDSRKFFTYFKASF